MNRYLLRAALILAKTFYLLLAGVSIFAGVENAQTLWLASASQAGFVQAAGTIDAVIKHDDPNYEGVGKPTFVAEVKFSYPAAGGRLASNTLSPLCTWCTPAEVLAATGFRPSQLAPGTKVVVHVKRDAPSVSYLKLASSDELWTQLGFTLLWLVLVPAFLYVHHCGFLPKWP